MALVGERQVPDPTTGQSLQGLVTGLSGMTSRPTTPQTTSIPTTPPSNPQAFAQEYVARSAWKHGVMGTLSVLTSILAARLTLLVAVCGAIALAYLALEGSDPMKLGALAIYTVVVVVPLVALVARQ
jgi:ABC-type glycerol-3-phosphate transport system permease component